MSRSSRVALAVCFGMAIAALVGTSVPVAFASDDPRPSRVVLRDVGGDVWKVNVRTSHWTPVGELPAADIRRAVVKHRDHTVVIRARFENLRRVGVQNYRTGIATPDGDFVAKVTSSPRGRTGTHALHQESEPQPIECAGLSHRIDYADDAVTLRIPRGCLGRPRWVKANIGNLLVLGDKPHRRHYADNPHDEDAYSNFGTARIYRD